MIEERVDSLGGVARTGEIVRTSGDRRRLAASVSAGTLTRVARGVVARPGLEDVGIALARGGALTCVSALRRAALPLLSPPALPHVTTPSARGSRGGAVVHWCEMPVGPGVAPLPLALLHAQRCLPADGWVAAADAAVRQGLDLASLAEHRPRRGRVRFDRLLRAVDGRSQSLPESLLRVALVAEGIHPEPQARLVGVGRVDLLIDNLVVEVDGFAYHSGREQYREDRRRDRAIHALGFRVIRYTYEDVVHRRAAAVAEIRSLLGMREQRCSSHGRFV